MPAKIILNPAEADVHPDRLLGWLRESLEDRGKITALEWNEAVHKLAGTGRK